MLLHFERFCAKWLLAFPKPSREMSKEMLLKLARLIKGDLTVFKVAFNSSEWHFQNFNFEAL
jgi:hypothetical protein